ncbi:MAG: TRAP transporter small permease [Dehalococcoidales bacterium]|jgi:TRAP-type C4-dicarboxylate transport system permease small subunit
MSLIIKVSDKLAYWFNWVAGGSLVLMVVLTCADVIMRSAGNPIRGTFEMVGLLGIFIAAYAMAYTQMFKEHVAISYLLKYLPAWGQNAVKSFVHLLSCGFFSLLCWQLFIFANDLRMSKEVSPTSEIPLYPFGYLLALACFVMAFTLFSDFIKTFRTTDK